VNAKSPARSQALFIFLSLALSLTFSILIADWVLGYQRQSIELSDRMDPGMIVYDARLGWKLKPYWSGKHHHYDYDVEYNINRDGFRGTDAAIKDGGISIVGDSFSFGLGVNDDETFTALLNESHHDIFYNHSVPGYSTDQQLLLVLKHRDEIAQHVLLVVYLGNDIFDNMRSYPLQADHGKPFFKLTGDTLSLENTPVPLQAKPAAVKAESVSSIILGEDSRRNNLAGWLARLEISQRIGLFQDKVSLSDDVMQSRFEESLILFNKLVTEMKDIIDKNNGRLSVVLMPGRSYVEQPGSLSAQFQEYFRSNITSSLTTGSSIEVLDLASHLRDLHINGVNDLYYPNEGHLTPLGHQYVADYLGEQIH
jgi:hypothetical protein